MFHAPRYTRTVQITDIEQIAKGTLIVGDGSGAPAEVTVGSNDLPLVADSTQAAGVAWKTLPIAGGGTNATSQTAAFDNLSPNTTKGDITVFDGTNNIRLAVGTNNYVLTADSTQASGLKWSAAAGGIAGSTGASDNVVLRSDGTGGATLQASAVRLDDSGNIYPVTSDVGALGSATNMWSDLFLASGSVVDFNNGDVLLTHSSNTLTLTGGGFVASYTGLPLTVTNTTDSASVQGLLIQGDRATPASNDILYTSFQLSNSIGTQTEVARVSIKMTDVTSASEDSEIAFSNVKAGVLTGLFTVDSSRIYPTTNDGLALGWTVNKWSDLFLASGGTIDFNSGDVILTHSSNLLTLSGGNLALGTNSLTMTGSIAATGARVTKGWFTNLESTNAPTVGGAAVYYTGGTDVIVADGGSGRSTATAYAVICGGTTSTGAHQSIASVGTSGQVLTSNGAGALPTFQDAAGGTLNSVVSTWLNVPNVGGFYDLSNTNLFTGAGGGSTTIDRTGIVRLASSSTSGSGGTISQNTDTVYITNPWDCDQVFGAVVWVKETTTQDCFWGVGNSAATAGAVAADATLNDQHIGFFVQDGTLYASNASGSAQTKTDVSTGITLAAYNTYEWTLTGDTNIVFKINGSTVATHSTNLPTTQDTNFGIAFGVETQTTDFRSMHVGRQPYHVIDLTNAVGA